MNPVIASLDTLFANVLVGLCDRDLLKVGTLLCHRFLPLLGSICKSGCTCSGAVVQPSGREVLLVQQVVPAVSHTGGADRGTGTDLAAIFQLDAHLLRRDALRQHPRAPGRR